MRINVIPVSELYDQHLVAEYREIKMLPKMLCRSLNSKKGVDFDKLPKEYTLNKGHGKFFYDKLLFIEKRFDEILQEMSSRGFKTSSVDLYMKDYDYSSICFDSSCDAIFPPLYKDYIPTKEAIEINCERIVLRVSEVKNFYRYYGKLIDKA